MSTQPPRTHGLTNDPQVLGIFLALLVTIGSACESTAKNAGGDLTVTTTGEATAPASSNTPKAANAAKPTNTPKPADTPKATSNPKPAESPTTAGAVQTVAPGATSTTAPAQAPSATPQSATKGPPTIAPAPTATSATVGYSLPACYKAGQNTCNCADFSTHAYAQWFHDNYDRADVNGLDGNPKDGVVCEGRP